MRQDVVSLSEMCAILGLSERSISQLVRDGRLERISRGKYRLQSIAGYVAHLREIAANRGGETGAVSLAEERARLTRAQADAAELKAEALRGSLIEAEAVETEWFDILRRVRAGIMAAPSRIRQRLPHLTAEDGAEIDVELREVLSEIADD